MKQRHCLKEGCGSSSLSCLGYSTSKLLGVNERFLTSANFSIWRPLQRVTSWPLVLCDSRTIRPDDLVSCDIVRRRYIGETYFGKYNPEQKWHYNSNINRDDVILLKIYDSEPDVTGKGMSCRPIPPTIAVFHRLLD
jgi:hypothetical protein